MGKGKYAERSTIDSCKPIYKVENLWKEQRFSVAEKKKMKKNGWTPEKYLDEIAKKGVSRDLTEDSVAIPCGLVAKSVFTDSYVLEPTKKE